MSVFSSLLTVGKQYFSFKDNPYNLTVADIVEKRGKISVIFQCAQTNTFVSYPLDVIMDNEKMLANISPKVVRLLSEINLSNQEKSRVALTEDGAFVYNRDSECFYSMDELLALSENDAFIKSLGSKDSFLLGYLIGKNEKKQKSKNTKMFLVK